MAYKTLAAAAIYIALASVPSIGLIFHEAHRREMYTQFKARADSMGYHVDKRYYPGSRCIDIMLRNPQGLRIGTIFNTSGVAQDCEKQLGSFFAKEPMLLLFESNAPMHESAELEGFEVYTCQGCY